MDRIELYLDIVPIPILLAGAMVAVLVYLAVPAQYRLVIALAIVPIWLTVGRLPDLGIISQAAKVSSAMVFFLVGLGAFLHPGPRRQVPPIAWLYMVMACVMFLYVLQVQDRTLALILRMQWLMVVFAAIMLIRTVVHVQDLTRIINGLAFGCFLALLLPLSGLILFPGDSFLRGAGRFQPYGVNSNQIGMLFALSIPLLYYKAITTRAVSLKPIIFAAIGITIGMALLTASRQTLLAILMVGIPIIFKLSRRPIITIIGLAVGLAAVSYVIGMAENTAFDRFADLESNRFEVWAAYTRDVYTQRPLFGLFGVNSELAFRSSVVQAHPHSAYFNLMYMGGLSLLIPMMILLCTSLSCAFRTWRMRHQIGVDPFLISILGMLLVAMYTQGIFNQVVYWPTYAWSFCHVILAIFFITVGTALKEEDPAWVLPDLEDEDWDHEAEWDAYEELEEPAVQGY
ncbi:MAG: hypothetical protein P8K80_10750 [Phycisphaerales bacterium]|nr:hypothetical protein [Phycisphaerales bacterium]